ncbi:RNA polymerase sigma factor [Arthrobacter roseus]|uniref:RNA polymerase sigma factor n=1 Tax=Arthrobacter roseus TaxID=136274 RepID=UPI00308441B8|nr:RNA polymerase sigma factor (sigma-70 family) [Arthrobacter roseus]
MGAYPALEAGITVEAWLVTIAKRKAIDQHRMTGRTPVPVDLLPESVLPEGVLQEQTLSEDHDGELAAALQLLPLRQREAIAYHYLAGLPYREVAEILGNSEAAARRSAADGMQKLRLHYRQSLPQVVHHNV